MFRNNNIKSASIIILSIFWMFTLSCDSIKGMLGGNKMSIKIRSSAFEEGGMIPKKYSCDGQDVSPQLSWSAPPKGTESIAIVCDDPDAPGGVWVHWVIFNISPDVTELDENLPPDKSFPDGSIHGKNDFGKLGYGGPCPPGGTHRYYFKLYALDTMLNLHPGITKKELVQAMQGHILAESHLLGKYER